MYIPALCAQRSWCPLGKRLGVSQEVHAENRTRRLGRYARSGQKACKTPTNDPGAMSGRGGGGYVLPYNPAGWRTTNPAVEAIESDQREPDSASATVS